MRRSTHGFGFTLIELIAVMIVLGILAGVAVPRLFSYREQAAESAEQAVVGAVRSAISNTYAKATAQGTPGYPLRLDDAAPEDEASGSNPFFDNVLGTPVSDGWTKGESPHTYIGPAGNTYVYVPATGNFFSNADYQGYLASGGSVGGGGSGGDGDDALAGGAGGGAEGDGNGAGDDPLPPLATIDPSSLSLEELAALSAEEIAQLTQEQIEGFSYEQFEAVAWGLSDGQIPWASPEQIAMLSADEFGRLTDAQRAAITDAQWAERAISDDVRSLGSREFRNVDPNHVKYLTGEQLGDLRSPYDFWNMSAEARHALRDVQVQALDTAAVGIRHLSDQQRLVLVPEQVEALNSREFRYLPPDQVEHLTGNQLGALRSPYDFWNMSVDARHALNAQQVQALDTAEVGIRHLSDAQRGDITTDQVQDLSSRELRYLPADRAAEISTEQLSSLRSPYDFWNMSSEARHALTTDQVRALDTAEVGLAHLSEAQRTEITSEQVQAVDSRQLRYLPDSKVRDISPDQLANLRSPYDFWNMSSDARRRLSAEQVQALDTGQVGLAHLSESQRSQVTPQQVQAIDSRQLRYLPVEKVVDVAPSQLADLQSPYDFWNMPADARHALAPEQIQMMDTSSVGLNHFDESQREQLTTSQIQAVDSRQLRYVPPSRAAELAPQQLANLRSVYDFSNMPAEARHALTGNQVQAMDTSQVGLRYFSDDQRGQLTSQQIGQVDSREFRYVPDSQVANITADQLSRTRSVYDITNMSSSARHAFNAEQINAIPDSMWSSVENRFTEEQRSWRSS